MKLCCRLRGPLSILSVPPNGLIFRHIEPGPEKLACNVAHAIYNNRHGFSYRFYRANPWQPVPVRKRTVEGATQCAIGSGQTGLKTLQDHPLSQVWPPRLN